MPNDPRIVPEEPNAPDFQDILDLYITSERSIFEAARSEQTAWRASSIGYCPRRQYLKRAGVPQLKDERQASDFRTLTWGDNIHYFMKNLVRRAGLFIAEEIKMHDEILDVTGTCDLLWGGKLERFEPREQRNMWDDFIEVFRKNMFEEYGDHLPVILTEVKSAKTYAIEKAKEYGAREVNAAYHEQLALYYILSTLHPDQLPCAVDVYRLTIVGKETADILSFGLQQSAIDRVWWKVELLAEAWAGGKVPPCTCTTDGPKRKTKPYPWTVEYCDYFDGQSRCCHDELLEVAEKIRSGIVTPDDIKVQQEVVSV